MPDPRPLSCLLLLAALTCHAASAPQLSPIAEVSPERLERPYQRLVLDLAGAPPEADGLQVTLGVLGDEVVQIWALAPQWGSQRLISRTGSLAWDGNRLRGTGYVLIADPRVDKLQYKSSKHGGLWYGITIDAMLSGRSASGSYSCQRSNPRVDNQEQAQGKLTGMVVTREQLDRLHPLREGSDFPCWRGSFGNGTAIDSGEELVEDLAQAALLWASEESELPGTYNIVMGGLGGPVVAGGKVYLSYVMPNGPTFDEDWWAKLVPDGPEKEDRISYYGHLAGDYGAQWLRRRASIQADDVVLCVDAQTGLTVWKRVFPAAARNPSYSSRNWSWAKNGPFTTPCVADGRVYTIGGHGTIYCLDAATGADLWQGGLPSSPNARAHLDEAVAQGQMVQRVKSRPGAADYVVSLCHAEGIIVANDNGSSVMGLDAETGKRLWGDVTIDGLGRGRGGGAHSGVLMPLGERTLVVMGPAIMDLKTGAVLWQVDRRYFAGELGNACVAGDVIVFANGIKNEGSDIGLSAWRVEANGGVQLLWSMDDTWCGTNFSTPTIYQDHLYATTRPKEGGNEGEVLCVDLRSGEIRGRAPGQRGEGSIAQLLAGDGRLLVGQQAGSWWTTDPSDFRRLCAFPGGDSVPNNQSSHPQAMCGGRLYSRGDFNLVCWDLRQAAVASRQP